MNIKKKRKYDNKKNQIVTSQANNIDKKNELSFNNKENLDNKEYSEDTKNSQNIKINKDNYRKFINEELYPLVTHNMNINPLYLRLINVIGDGNCLFRSIARFHLRYPNVDLKLQY